MWAQGSIDFKWTDYSATTTDNNRGLGDWDGTHRLSYAAHHGFIS
jgi:hypothetical protein